MMGHPRASQEQPVYRPVEIAERYHAMGLATVAALGLVCGAILQQVSAFGYLAWISAIAIILLALAIQIFRSLRNGDFGLDVIAAFSMSAALLFGEYLAANVVALMYAGGELLEDYARRRAKREMSALLGCVSRSAVVYRGRGIEEVPVRQFDPPTGFLSARARFCPWMVASPAWRQSWTFRR
jgi:cation transport ATPase